MKFSLISKEQYDKDFNEVISSYEDLKLPKRATKGSAGYDFYSPFGIVLGPGESAIIPTGVNVKVDDDKFLLMLPRSGQGFKYKVQLYNTAGVIDSDYFGNPKNEGHIFVKLFNDSPEGKILHVHKGEAFCQGIIMKYYTVDNDETTDERIGGFGSTSEVKV